METGEKQWKKVVAPPQAKTGVDEVLRVQVVTDYPALLGLEADWLRFTQELEDAPPFASHEWTAAWWKSFGHDKRLHIVIVWSGSRIRGIAPLMLSNERRYGIPLLRLGSLYNNQVQRLEMVVEDQDKIAFLGALWQHLLDMDEKWDVLELCQFDDASVTLSTLRRLAVNAGFSVGDWVQGHSPYLPIMGSWQDYFDSISASRRSTLRRKLRKLNKLFEKGENVKEGGKAGERGQDDNVALETVCSGPDLRSALKAGFAIEAMAWKGDQGTAIVSEEDTHQFYLDLAQRMAANNKLRLYFLKAGEQRIAFQYCLEFNDKLYLLKPGYNSAYSQYSPSQLLSWLVLQQAFESGKKEYDFLGDSDEWKMKWTGKTRKNAWFYAVRPTLPGLLFSLIKLRLIPQLKKLRQTL